jgi:hypothetical protein
VAVSADFNAGQFVGTKIEVIPHGCLWPVSVPSLTAIRDDLPVKFLLRRGEEKAGEVQAARSRRTTSAKARKAIFMAQKARRAKWKAAEKKS